MSMKLLPTFFGSKARWASRLSQFVGERFVEPFAGSAGLSMALSAPGCLWNDTDEALSLVLSQFDQQQVPDIFTLSDFYEVRERVDWYRWAFCLQSMSYAGLFRWSRRSGRYNAPPDRRIQIINPRLQYECALARWRDLKPLCRCGDWRDLIVDDYRGAVVVMDPPYRNSRAPYGNQFLTDSNYWKFIENIIRPVAKAVVCFEYAEVLQERFPDRVIQTRNMRPIGKRAGRVEGCVIL